MSLPALLNICLLLFLVMFIFAVFGISLFKNVKIRPGFNDVHNFKTFFKTFILLFQMATSAGWAETLTAIFDDTDCKEPDPEIGENGDCGKFGAAIGYLIVYLVMSFLVIVNMYIAVILENYNQASEDMVDGITDEDYDLFYEIWQVADFFTLTLKEMIINFDRSLTPMAHNTWTIKTYLSSLTFWTLLFK